MDTKQFERIGNGLIADFMGMRYCELKEGGFGYFIIEEYRDVV